jgi:hypothetical protein
LSRHFRVHYPRKFNDSRRLTAIHQKSIPKNVDVRRKILRVAPAAATGRHREKLERARLNETSSASLISLPVKRSLKVWVPQILPLWKNQPSQDLPLAGGERVRLDEEDLLERKTKNHIVCCVLNFLI